MMLVDEMTRMLYCTMTRSYQSRSTSVVRGVQKHSSLLYCGKPRGQIWTSMNLPLALYPMLLAQVDQGDAHDEDDRITSDEGQIF